MDRGKTGGFRFDSDKRLEIRTVSLFARHGLQPRGGESPGRGAFGDKLQGDGNAAQHVWRRQGLALLKEQILSIFDDKTSTFEKICDRIKCWFENILSNNLEEFKEVIKTMQRYMYGILNYFRYGMTNAIAEGFNTKINVIKRRAFGYRDLEYFMLKIYQSSLRRLA